MVEANAMKAVFGYDVKFDADGQPIERGFGNLTDREPVAVEPEPVAVEPEPVAVEPEPVAVEPEPVTVEPEPVAVEPEPVATIDTDIEF